MEYIVWIRITEKWTMAFRFHITVDLTSCVNNTKNNHCNTLITRLVNTFYLMGEYNFNICNTIFELL